MADAQAGRQWERLSCIYDNEGIGERASIGLVALARDRVAIADVEAFYQGLEGVAVFSTRIASPDIVTADSLRGMRGDLRQGAELLVPGSRLDVLGFCCTSGTAAIGTAEVAAALREGRGDLPVATPMEAAVKALSAINARRIALLVPYLEDAANLVAGFIEAAGIEPVRRATFNLAGDADMNRLSEAAIAQAASGLVGTDIDALFVSCTALRTAGLVDRLERQLRLPVLTSNQVMAWDCLRMAGVADTVAGRGSLFTS